MTLRHYKGFTLIELMITVAIIAIIAAIAYPSYLEQVRETRRTNAQADLLELVSYMERYYGQNFSYVDAALPFNNSPKQGTSFYNIRFTAAPSATAYTIQADPTGSQSNDRCGTLTINQNNQTTPANNDCW